MKIAIIDNRADNKTVYTLENYGFKVIPTATVATLYDAVCSHADMQIHYLSKNKFICAPEVFNHYKKLLPQDFQLISGSQNIGSSYPYDIAYNAAALNDFVICNARYTAIEIISEYKCMKQNILNVKQGYAKCSTAIITGNSIITADTGICKTAEKNGIDVLKINQGCVKLKGMNYGFIGGATGLLDKNTLAVNGDINTHTDAPRIKEFCSRHHIEILSLKDRDLIDIGSIITNFDV